MERCRPSTKGIKNVSGVACHVSSAIQLLYHAISEYTRSDLILLSKELETENLNQSNNDDCNSTSAFLTELGNLFRDIGNHDLLSSDELDIVNDRQSVDPTKFYNLIMPNIDSLHVGDAGTSLRVILSSTRKALERLVVIRHDDDDGGVLQLAKTVFDDLQKLFWKGEMTHQIIGSKMLREEGENVCGDHARGRDNTIMSIRIERRKQKRVRALPCPLPIPLKRHDTTHSSLQNVLFSNTEILEYNWDILENSEYDETREPIESCLSKAHVSKKKETALDHLDDCDASVDSSLETDSSSDSSFSSSSSSSSTTSSSSCSSIDESSTTTATLSSSCWTTYKHLTTQSLPEVLILQLPRYEYVNGRKQVSSVSINVLYELELHILSKQYLYRLDGAIVYQDDRELDTYNLESLDHGHYVCYFKECDEDTNEGELWKKVDDDKVSVFVVHDGISQSRDKKVTVSRKALCRLFGGKIRNKRYFATLLMYKLINKKE